MLQVPLLVVLLYFLVALMLMLLLLHYSRPSGAVLQAFVVYRENRECSVGRAWGV